MTVWSCAVTSLRVFGRLQRSLADVSGELVKHCILFLHPWLSFRRLCRLVLFLGGSICSRGSLSGLEVEETGHDEDQGSEPMCLEVLKCRFDELVVTSGNDRWPELVSLKLNMEQSFR